MGPTALWAVGAALKYFGDRASARSQKRFEERMSNTAYSRAVRDMLSAGLNPALAYTQGGASTPSVGMTQGADLGGGALRLSEMKQQRPLVRSEIGLKDALAGEAAAGTAKALQDIEASKTLQDLHRSEMRLKNTLNMIELSRVPKEQFKGSFWSGFSDLTKSIVNSMREDYRKRRPDIALPPISVNPSSAGAIKRMLVEEKKEVPERR